MKTDPLAFKKVFNKLKQHGFLLESDPRLPSVCSIIAGEPMRGSWWSHPMAQTIFNVNEQLEDHEEVLITKLISAKITFIHKHLWSEVMSIGTSNSDWQTAGLKDEANSLLESIAREGQMRTDKLDWPSRFKTKPGDAARQLEERLLIVSSSVHTETGAHAKQIESWKHWSQRVGYQGERLKASAAMDRLEALLTELNKKFEGKATLPWGALAQKSSQLVNRRLRRPV